MPESGWDSDFWALQDWYREAMSRVAAGGRSMSFPGTYVLRRLLIAVPSLLGISVVLFTVLALAPGDPFGELVSNPNIPAEVAANLRLKFGMDDPVVVRYLRWLAAMLQGDWGFSFASRIDVDDLIMQRLPTTLLVIGSSQVLAHCWSHCRSGSMRRRARIRCSTRSPAR